MVKPVYAFRYKDDVCIAMMDRNITYNSIAELDGVKSQYIVYRYKGNLGVELNLEVCDSLIVKCKFIRSRDEFLYYLKILYPSMNLNPIYLCDGNIVLDNPYVEIGGNNYCTWHPRFEMKASMKHISQDSNCMVYHFQEPIFIFTFDYKRHTQAVNEEYFSLNYLTGVAIHSWKVATRHEYTEYSSHFDGKSWIQDYFSQTPITGFKSR